LPIIEEKMIELTQQEKKVLDIKKSQTTLKKQIVKNKMIRQENKLIILCRTQNLGRRKI